MTKTLFVLPGVERSALSCVWIDTGNSAQPLACVWIDRDLHIAGTDALCGIWANSKSFLLARGRRADRVGQQATQRTASTGMSGRIPISSEELL
jgi:hypothetical protein